jgi:methyltransferase (TIGR00027 family)
MREGSPSLTAQRVATYRLGFERLSAPSGDGSADERLARDVAESSASGFVENERMARYLRGRTAFFDRVVVNGLGRGVAQVAAIGAGYDGRALRYAKPGVRWFELDHPVTQADKRLRLDRLQIDATPIAFVAVDLADGGTASALLEAGWLADAPSLMLCEGLSVYLKPPALRMLLEDLRSLAAPGTRLAISLTPPGAEAKRLSQRARFREAIAEAGEPAANDLTAEAAKELLAAAHWRPADLSERARRAGLTVAAPVWQPATDPAPPTTGRIGRYLEQLYYRRGIAGLPEHLEDAYGITVTGAKELDAGVVRVQHEDGSAWIARVFPGHRPHEAAAGDVEILRFLERVAYPAERCAAAEPLTSYEGQAVLVTEYVNGSRVRGAPGYRALGELLGRLHTLPPTPDAVARPGGGWHHLVSQGSPEDEIAAAASLLDNAAARVSRAGLGDYEHLRQAVAGAEDCAGLPQALIHPDVAPVNAVAPRTGDPVLVDWTGAGQGPRLWSLAFLLWAAGYSRLSGVDAVASGYASRVELEPAERQRLAAAIMARPLVFNAWSVATGREQLPVVADKLPALADRAQKIAARALRTLDQHR